LASDEQLGESGITVAGSGSGRGVKPDTDLRVAPRLANEYGGDPSNWVKKQVQHLMRQIILILKFTGMKILKQVRELKQKL
jgi:hypothetical protein